MISESLGRDSKGRFIPRYSEYERFMKKIEITEDSCWNWLAGKLRDGYGVFKCVDGIDRRAHRVMWEVRFGKIPEGKMVLHKCDNPSCVRPSHLYVGTAKDNSDDMRERGSPHYPKGVEHGHAKLTEADVKKIRLLDGIMSQNNMAEHFNVSQAQIWRIVNNQSWSHIN